MKFRPLHDRVLIKVLDSEEKTKGGLYRPESNKEQMKGEVIAVGEGIFTSTGKKIPMKLKVGDTVIVPNTGTQLRLDGDKYNLYREQEILIRLS